MKDLTWNNVGSICRVINSCETLTQLENAKRLVSSKVNTFEDNFNEKVIRLNNCISNKEKELDSNEIESMPYWNGKI